MAADPESVLTPPEKREEKKRNESGVLVVVNHRDDVHEHVGMSEIIAMPGTSEPKKRQCKKKRTG
jgi:anti-sigma factor ChrR (cupin superfamily)